MELDKTHFRITGDSTPSFRSEVPAKASAKVKSLTDIKVPLVRSPSQIYTRRSGQPIKFQ